MTTSDAPSCGPTTLDTRDAWLAARSSTTVFFVCIAGYCVAAFVFGFPALRDAVPASLTPTYRAIADLSFPLLFTTTPLFFAYQRVVEDRKLVEGKQTAKA